MIRALRFNERDGARQHGAVAGAYAADQRRDVGRGEGGGTGVGLHGTSLTEPPVSVIRLCAVLQPHRDHGHRIWPGRTNCHCCGNLMKISKPCVWLILRELYLPLAPLTRIMAPW